MNLSEFINNISSGSFDEQFRMLYGSSERAVLRARARYLNTAERFSREYPESGDISVFSAPAQIVAGGVRCQGCRVLSAAVSLDMIAIVSFHEQGIIRIKSDALEAVEVKLGGTEAAKKKQAGYGELIRSIAERFGKKGVETGGFDAYISSDIPAGKGFGELAAFEVLAGAVINAGFGGRYEGAEIAETVRAAETECFGKPERAPEQLASALGGFVLTDISPRHIELDLERSGYSVCMTDASGDSAERGDISNDIFCVAKAMGAELLGEVKEEEYHDKLPELRRLCSDRELLSAAYFFAENETAADEADALSDGDTERFFELADRSGSACTELCSCDEGVVLGAALSRRILGGNGAVRVQDGMIQAFLPSYLAEDYEKEMERVFGYGSCCILTVRNTGVRPLAL